MRASSFKYLTSQGVKGLWKNRMMTLASVGVLTACLLIVGFAVLLTENINEMVHYVENQHEFKAFVLKEEEYAEQENINQLSGSEWDALMQEMESEISAIPNVAEVTFVSKDEGIDSLKGQLGEQGEVLNEYVGEENPLPDSFTIKVKDLNELTATTTAVQKLTGVESVSYASDVATTLTDIRRIVNVVGWAIVGALVIVSLVIITNTIRASIFTRRKELNIMKYVGATNSFIRLPFIVEGICLGLLGAGVSYLIIWAGYSSILNSFAGQTSSFLKDAFQSIIPFKEVAVHLAVFFVVSSVGIGVLGSAVSIRNHIKV